MPVVGKELFVSETAAGDSPQFRVRAADGNKAVVLYNPGGLGAGETLEVRIWGPDGTWFSYTNAAGNAQSQTSSGGSGFFYIDTPGVYVVNKTATISGLSCVAYIGGMAGDTD